ncbi:hypothetical protein GH816_03020 [Betaproteobacteria bacterium LSUCC0115]|nr:hypothetical protein [Burkholderiales bacterium LSUCC0115]
MNTFDISRESLSRLFWMKVAEDHLRAFNIEYPDYFKKLHEMRRLIADAEFKTGSVLTGSAITLAMASAHFSPASIAEVGTFIGRSTYSMACGSMLYSRMEQEVSLVTCDFSNDIPIPIDIAGFKLSQYPKKSSTQMFTDLVSKQVVLDFVYIDGRLDIADLDLLSKITSDRTVIALDDYEGNEKGVDNAALIQNHTISQKRLLIYPATRDVLYSHYDLSGYSTTALFIPQSLLRLTRQ